MLNVARTDLPSLKHYNQYLEKIWKSHWVTNNGKFVELLEKKLQKKLSVDNLVIVNNATNGLLISLKVLALEGEVITTPFTFVASTNVILWERLTPVFVDINKNTFNIDPIEVEKKITKKTSAILAVHVYGNPCDLEILAKIARKYNLKLIYDAAHAFGVKYKNNSVLNYGDISVLSFHATKTFHTIEGGALVAKNKKLVNRFKLLRNFGIKSEDKILAPGINAKMNEFQAAMGLSNLLDIDKSIAKRKIIYEYYRRKLKGVKFQELSATYYNYSYMPVIFENRKVRDNVYSILLKNKIKTRKYFYPLTSDLLYVKKISGNKKYPNSKMISDGVLCLPLYSSIKISDVNRIIKIINKSI